MSARSGARELAAAAAALALLATAQAGVQWSATGALHTSVAGPPVVFEAGAGGLNTRYFEGFAVSSAGTSFSADFKAKAGGETRVKDVAHLVSRADGARTVTLRAPQTTSAGLTAFAWTVRDGSTAVASLDTLLPGASATFTMPAGARFDLDLRARIVEGAGRHDTTVPFSITMEVR